MPPTSIDILLADELVAAINAQVFSLEFTAERLYAPDWEALKELDTLQVGVWMGDPEADVNYERSATQKTFPINLAFVQRLVAKTLAEIDALCDLVMEVVNFLELQKVVTDVGNHELLNNGWEFRLRFDINSINRTKRGDGSILYTGQFASVVSFPFLLLD